MKPRIDHPIAISTILLTRARQSGKRTSTKDANYILQGVNQHANILGIQYSWVIMDLRLSNLQYSQKKVIFQFQVTVIPPQNSLRLFGGSMASFKRENVVPQIWIYVPCHGSSGMAPINHVTVLTCMLLYLQYL